MEGLLAWLNKTLTGVVVGTGSALIFQGDPQTRFGVALAALLVVLVALYLRSKRGAPIHTVVAWASVGLALTAVMVGLVGQDAWQGYMVLAAGLAATVAILSADGFDAAMSTLEGIAALALAVFLSVELLQFNPLNGVLTASLAVFGLATLTRISRLRSAALAGVGVGLVLWGMDAFRAEEPLYGLAFAGVGIGLAVFGVAAASLGDKLRLPPAAWAVLGVALIVVGGLTFYYGWGFFTAIGDPPLYLAGAALFGLALALAGHGVAILGRLVRGWPGLADWWHRFTTVPDQQDAQRPR